MGRKVRLRRFTGPPRSWVETFQTVSLGDSMNRGNSPSSVLWVQALFTHWKKPGLVMGHQTG